MVLDLPGLSARPPLRDRLPAPMWLLWIAIVVSAALHVGFGWMVGQVLSAPPIDIEFQVPIDVELGLSEEVAMAATPPAAEPPSAESPSADKTSGEGPEKPKEEPKPKRTPDAGTLDEKQADAGLAIADAAVPAADAGVGFGTSNVGTRLPPGAQIALRVDMSRIRSSPIADDMRAFVAAIPDWKALLEGSGISPVDQLDRLLIATPDLKREKVVLAGRFIGEQSVVEGAVAKLAAERGKKALWHPEGDVRIAPWFNADVTPRVIALVGPQHFTISRSQDLPRILSIANARAVERASGEKPVELPADALLSMDEGEGLSLEIDGVEQFIKRAPRGVPSKLRVSVIEVQGATISVRGRLVFADAEKAADGLRFWDAVRKSYARNALIGLLGLAEPLQNAVLELADKEVGIRVELSVEQTRLILGYVRGFLSPPAPMPTSAVPASAVAPAPVAPPDASKTP